MNQLDMLIRMLSRCDEQLCFIVIIILLNSMAEIQVLQNKFSKSSLEQILAYLKVIDFAEPASKIITLIEQVSSKEYLWAIGKNPAYHIQYQVDACAILKARNHILIVWRAKFIEYPMMVKFPELKDKKLNNLVLEVVSSSVSEQTKDLVFEYLSCFYGTYFHSDKSFETNLVSFAKHYITKITSVCYWHCLLEDNDKLFLTHEQDMQCHLKIHVHGLTNYSKVLYLFSYKGSKSGIFTTVKNKWMQVFSFLGMVIIFFSMTYCSGENHQGICQHKDNMTMLGAGIMMALLGVRFTSKKSKKNKTQIENNPEKDKKRA